jgi:hypothetical protein
VLTRLVPGPTTLPSAAAHIGSWLPRVLAAGLIEFISELAELNRDRPEAGIIADDPVPEASVVADVRALDDEVKLDNDDSGEVDDDEDEVAEAVNATPDIVCGCVSRNTFAPPHTMTTGNGP